MKNKSPFDTHVRMKMIREELGMTQRFVAERLGVANSNYYLMENGQQHIKLVQIIDFWNLIYERGYSMNLETLITGKERSGVPVMKHITSL